MGPTDDDVGDEAFGGPARVSAAQWLQASFGRLGMSHGAAGGGSVRGSMGSRAGGSTPVERLGSAWAGAGAGAGASGCTAIREKALGPSDPDLAMSFTALARIERERGRPGAAIGHDERAVKIMEDTHGKEHTRLAEPLTGLAESLLAARRPAEALAPLERALAITAPRPEFHVVVVWQRFLLAQALWDSGGDRSRARALAEQVASDPESAKDATFLAKVQGWLANRRQ